MSGLDSDIVISQLQTLAKIYQHEGEYFKERAFTKAVEKIKDIYPTGTLIYLRDLEDIPGIGSGILRRLTELFLTGVIEELKDYQDKDSVIELFLGIYGVGPKKAEEWYNEGYRQLSDIPYQNLTTAQKIGIKYYKDINGPRIPREEIDKINDLIQILLKEWNYQNGTKYRAVVAGSYRRLKKTSGDIDLLYDGDPEFVDFLFEKRLLTEELSFGKVKFSGLIQLPGGSFPHRRIDIEFTDSWPFALLYFTGSKDFNRVMRNVAKEQGYLLNHKGLFDNKGYQMTGLKTEENIFEFLGIEYLEPEKRG